MACEFMTKCGLCKLKSQFLPVTCEFYTQPVVRLEIKKDQEEKPANEGKKNENND